MKGVSAYSLRLPSDMLLNVAMPNGGIYGVNNLIGGVFTPGAFPIGTSDVCHVCVVCGVWFQGGVHRGAKQEG